MAEQEPQLPQEWVQLAAWDAVQALRYARLVGGDDATHNQVHDVIAKAIRDNPERKREQARLERLRGAVEAALDVAGEYGHDRHRGTDELKPFAEILKAAVEGDE